MIDFGAYFFWTFFGIGFLAVASYIIPVIYQCFFLVEQDLKKKYGAEWALVTGGSSGIGKAIAEKLAQQNINVVIVALPDKLLNDSVFELSKKYPNVKFVAIGANLGATDYNSYLNVIKAQTKGLPIKLIFNNAGYLLPGIFNKQHLEKSLANLNCNATSHVVLTHLFANRMLELPVSDGCKRGLIAFVSSSAAFLPGPISSLYASTKCFLTSFSTSIGIELKEDGIDVVCVHPSPIQSNFFNSAKGINMLTVFQKTAKPPSTIADTIFKAAGKCMIRDQGYFSIGSKLLLKAVDWNMMTEIAPYFISSNPDFRKLKDVVKEE